MLPEKYQPNVVDVVCCLLMLACFTLAKSAVGAAASCQLPIANCGKLAVKRYIKAKLAMQPS